MSAMEAGGYFFPVVFAIATALPVIIVAWLLAFSFAEVGRFYNSVQKFEKWFSKAIALIFIIIGIYYTYSFYF